MTNFHFEICGELITDDFVELMSKARKGLFQIETGIQSTNKKTLASVKRSVAVEKTLDNIKKLTALPNIKVHVSLIAGLPFEDYNKYKDSFNTVYRLSADTFQAGFLKLLRTWRALKLCVY